MIEYLFSALTPLNILLALMGVAAGTIIGSIPGLTATMAVAVLVPVTFSMQPDSALILMGAIYTGAIYGGAYAAILLNTPGTPSAIATTFDGYPIAKRGDGEITSAIFEMAVADFMPPQETQMIDFMEMLAVFETSRRSMLPDRFKNMTPQEVQQQLQVLRNAI